MDCLDLVESPRMLEMHFLIGHNYARRNTRVWKHWFPNTRSAHERCTGRPSAVIR